MDEQIKYSDLQKVTEDSESTAESTNNTNKTLPDADEAAAPQDKQAPAAPQDKQAPATLQDKQAPAAPQGLCTLNSSGTSIGLKWYGSSDNVDVTGYDIYKNDIRPQGINLLKNGGFEVGLTGWKLELENDKFNSAKMAADNSEIYSGTKSAKIKITNKSGETSIENCTVRLIQQDIPVVAGKKYIVSFKAKSSILKSASIETGQNSKQYETLGTWHGSRIELTDSWRFFKQVFTAAESSPANTRFSISFEGTAGNVWIDDLEMFEASVTPYMLAGTSSKTVFTFKKLIPGYLHSFFVKARDAAGNISNESNVILFGINAIAATDPMLSKITIDGDTKDWSGFNPVTAGNGMVSSMSAAEDQGKLYILLEGTKIGNKNALFIDSDNDCSTGYISSDVKGADYYVDEGDNLFMYEDSGKLTWRYVGNALSYRSNTVLELALDLIDMKITDPGVVKILFRDWITQESIPSLEKGMAAAGTIITGIEDDTAPTVPMNLKSPAKTMKTATLTWTDSSDNIGVKGYVIFRDGIQAGTSPYNEFSDSGLSEGTGYQYYIKAYDAFGNMSGESNKITITTNSLRSGTGAITREYWNDMEASVDSFRSYYMLHNDPVEKDQSTSFASPVKLANYYATRMRGYLIPEKSGYYTFFISSDDSSELWLSTDENPENKSLITYVKGYTELCEWSKYKSQKSAVIKLRADQKYYIEAIYVEGIRGDHMEVGWQLPGSDSITVIAGANLSPVE